MGQELLNRGVKPYGTLWGASALYNRKYHKTVVKTHLDFIKAGAEIIVTNSFGSRKRRLIENGLVKEYKNLNVLAGKLAKKAVAMSKKKVLIAGSLPPQNFTYFADLGKDLNFIKKSFIWFENSERFSNFHILFLIYLTDFLGIQPENNTNNLKHFDLENGNFNSICESSNCIEGEVVEQLSLILGLSLIHI